MCLHSVQTTEIRTAFEAHVIVHGSKGWTVLASSLRYYKVAQALEGLLLFLREQLAINMGKCSFRYGQSLFSFRKKT